MSRILVADDEDDIRLLIKILLARSGFDILEAADGQEAVDIAAAELPDLIVLDIRMPRMTGIEALEALRTFEPTSGIPVLLVSAYVHDKDTRGHLEGHAVQYMTKPFQPHELLAKIQSMLGSAR